MFNLYKLKSILLGKMAHLAGDYCPYDAFDTLDESSSKLFGKPISDPNPLVKEAPTTPLTEDEIKAAMEAKQNSSKLGSALNALERKYGVDQIKEEDLRVWRAAMKDAFVDQTHLAHLSWKYEVEKARKEVAETENNQRRNRLERFLWRLENEDSRRNVRERFLASNQVTEEELKDHPMYRRREMDETILHPVALMVKRYREENPMICEVVSETDGEASEVVSETDGESKEKEEGESKEKEEEVPKSKSSWLPSLW